MYSYPSSVLVGSNLCICACVCTPLFSRSQLAQIFKHVQGETHVSSTVSLFTPPLRKSPSHHPKSHKLSFNWKVNRVDNSYLTPPTDRRAEESPLRMVLQVPGRPRLRCKSPSVGPIICVPMATLDHNNKNTHTHTSEKEKAGLHFDCYHLSSAGTRWRSWSASTLNFKVQNIPTQKKIYISEHDKI